MATKGVVAVDMARRFARRGTVTSPIRPFHLSEFGIDADSFLGRVAPSFHDLPLDPYDPSLAAEKLVRDNNIVRYKKHEREWLMLWEELSELQYTNALAGVEFWQNRVSEPDLLQEIDVLRPHRRRSSFQFLATPDTVPFRWQLMEAGCPTFLQDVEDERSRARRFAPMPQEVRQDRDIKTLICMACQLVSQTSGLVSQKFKVTAHQMLTYADADRGGEPAPEGIHQDGSDFIISALVVERQNVTGGVSKVFYTENRDLALEVELQQGDGILQSDVDLGLWHGVTAVYLDDPEREGYRSIIGLDIEFA